MRIYRYIPNGREYPSVMHTKAGQWWPTGIELGSVMAELYPKSYGNYPWPHEGNFFSVAGEEADLLPDFPAFALSVPLISARAADLLVRKRLIASPVALTVSGRPFFAVQPLTCAVNPGIGRAFVPERSQGLHLPAGEVFFYHTRSFALDQVPGEFFSIPEFEPFSDLYVTEKLVDTVRAAGLTGLEYLELVFDGAPVQPRYPPGTMPALPPFSLRGELEWDLLAARCDLLCYDLATIKSAVSAAVFDGYLTVEFVQPVYEQLID